MHNDFFHNSCAQPATAIQRHCEIEDLRKHAQRDQRPGVARESYLERLQRTCPCGGVVKAVMHKQTQPRPRPLRARRDYVLLHQEHRAPAARRSTVITTRTSRTSELQASQEIHKMQQPLPAILQQRREHQQQERDRSNRQRWPSEHAHQHPETKNSICASDWASKTLEGSG